MYKCPMMKYNAGVKMNVGFHYVMISRNAEKLKKGKYRAMFLLYYIL